VIASHLLGTFLFQVSALDPVVLVVASVFVLLLTLFASLLPAQRASSIDPMQALRGE
jgi:ABC-type lipoprotein release transport system permease subunit